ncbi:MAG: hypothetical protein GX631_05560 [Dehalococcoidales bacterium]|nr:hypothetical protein [Dehalococcoidales bacterium]
MQREEAMPLTVSEIARSLSYSKSNVLNLIRSGQLETLPRANERGKYLVDEAEFARFQESLASRDKSGREFAYVLLTRYISQLPDTFDRVRVDRSLINLESELKSVSLALGSLPHPYHYWAGMFSEISSALEMLRNSSMFNSLLDGDTMKLLPLLERDLRNCIGKMRVSLADKQDPGLTRDILNFRDTILEWTEFGSSWENLRDAAVRCFINRYSEDKYGELRHSSSVVVADPAMHREVIWNAFGLVFRPQAIANMAKLMARLAGHLGWQFDTICSLSTAALQLSSFLAYELHKSVVVIDNETYEFQPPEPSGASYVFVDTVCQTGNHLLQSIDRVGKLGARTVGAIFISMNDMMPEEQKRQRFQIIDDMRKDGRLIYAYDMSYLYRRTSLENLYPTTLPSQNGRPRL